MRALILTATLALVLATLVPLAPASASLFVSRYSVQVNGETALGYVAYPTDSPPTTLLVFGHGCCGKPDQSGFVAAYAQAYHVAAVAMDYRGPGGWDVLKGHEDLIAATIDLQSTFPITRTVIWGISMGGETTGMAVAARPDLYDYWVDTFGVTNLFEEFATLGTYPCGCDTSWMINEAGGTPATAPLAYVDRSPALHTLDMVGIKHAYIAHGIGDLVVPYSMSRETFTGLVAAGIPATLATVATGCCGTNGMYVPAGWVNPIYPLCTAQAGCVPPQVCEPTPAGNACTWNVPGPAAHDGRGAGPSYPVVDQLLRGLEPDAGVASREILVDYTVGQSVATP